MKTPLQKLTDDTLLDETQKLVREETRLTTEILHHLQEIESRKLFAARGYSSLFQYAVQELKYSEPAALLRIGAMRLLKVVPEAEEKIEKGEISLSVMAQAQKFFRREKKIGHEIPPEEKKAVVSSLAGKSLRESEKALLALSSEPESHRPESVRPVTPKLSEVKFLASEELLKDLEQLKGLLAHRHSDLSLAELIGILAKRALKDLDPAQKEEKRPRKTEEARVKELPRAPGVKVPAAVPAREAVPAAVKRAVWKRDGSCCSYVDPKTGRKCGSRFALEIDHIEPVGQGGGTISGFIAHNAWAAAQAYGREKIQPFWK